METYAAYAVPCAADDGMSHAACASSSRRNYAQRSRTDNRPNKRQFSREVRRDVVIWHILGAKLLLRNDLAQALMTASKADDTQWLTYWVVYSLLTFFETVAVGFVSWFPFYYELRLLLVLWLVLPQTKGAHYIFENYVCPFMVRYGASIDPAFKQAEKIMNSAQVAQAVKLSEQYGPHIAQQAMHRATEEAQRLAAAGKAGQGSGGSGGHAPNAYASSAQAPNTYATSAHTPKPYATGGPARY